MSLQGSLRLLWIRGLTDSVGPRSFTTEKFLDGKYVTVAGSNQSDGTILYAGDATAVVSYFSHEADRFASAAFETLLTGTKAQDFPRSTGWQLIRGYYAAFFALHALLRLHGWACTRLLPNTATKLNKELQLLFPGSQPVTAGLHLLKLQTDGRTIHCRRLDGTSQGGTHEALWSIMGDYLSDATGIVLSSSDTEHQVLVGLIDQFQLLVHKYGGPAWFTQLRNRVNYSHEHGAWFPYSKTTCDYDRIEAMLSKWRQHPEEALKLPGKDELIVFASACAFLVGTCSTTVCDLYTRSKSKSPFRLSSGSLVVKPQ